jgi:hypothetical protein
MLKQHPSEGASEPFASVDACGDDSCPDRLPELVPEISQLPSCERSSHHEWNEITVAILSFFRTHLIVVFFIHNSDV